MARIEVRRASRVQTHGIISQDYPLYGVHSYEALKLWLIAIEGYWREYPETAL